MVILKGILLIFLVIMIFNFVIFVHELGHYLAAKWRGMYVDRFQIWFGKPLLKKKIGEVQYGLGWLPLGGFVSLPQMADMEGIEGQVPEHIKGTLKPVTPMDKIIVAFAGPLFSFLLALATAVIVWGVGHPDQKIATTTIGYVSEESPANGILKAGDKILKVEGNKVTRWAGSHKESVDVEIKLSEGDTIEFVIERDGQTIELSTGYILPEAHFLARRHRQVGMYPEGEAIVGEMFENSPAELMGLKTGDKLIKVDGVKVMGPAHFSSLIEGKKEIVLGYLRGEEELSGKVVLAIPKDMDEYKIGLTWGMENSKFIEKSLVHPDPITQVVDHLGLMWTTITKVISPKNDINPGHMQGVVGISKNYYDMLQAEDGLRMVLWFTVLLNVNLAVLNLLPLPVLDGGHITTSLVEMLTGRAIPTKVMLVLQNSFVLLLMGFMLWVSSKDIFQIVPKEVKVSGPTEYIFEAPSAASGSDSRANDESSE